MSPHPDQHPDPATVIVGLAADATVLEARLSMLRDALGTVNARIAAVSEELRRLQCSVPSLGQR